MGAKIVPSIRYQDCRQTIAWLVKAFSFSEHLVVDEDGAIGHAQLVYKGVMLMLGQSHDDEFGRFNATPAKETVKVFRKACRKTRKLLIFSVIVDN